MSEGQIQQLNKLINKYPHNIQYVDFLAKIFATNKQWQKASQCYVNYIEKNKNDAVAYFNYAYNLRFTGEYTMAIDAYNEALFLGIDQPEEVFVNIALIYFEYIRDDEKTFTALKSALKENSKYIPALYNLANFYEDTGNKKLAIQQFEKILQIDSNYFDALARLAQIRKIAKPDDVLIKMLRVAIKKNKSVLSEQVNLYYALGKVLDDCGEYDEAFTFFSKANELDKKQVPEYNHENTQQYITRVKQIFTDNFFANLPVFSQESPIFICGMFRSGSTLIEQVLASHPSITAGGEREFLIRQVKSCLSPFPDKILEIKFEELKAISDKYIEELNLAFPNHKHITDKRPENYLYIGLIRALFPNARIIQTERNILDNCLSIFFLRLGPSMNYSLSLDSIVHYYKLQKDLMDYWHEIFPGYIYTVNYDQLINNFEKEARILLDYLGIEWHKNCLDFHKVNNTVKTASVWQVRQPLYKSSSGRWKNYKNNIPELLDLLDDSL